MILYYPVIYTEIVEIVSFFLVSLLNPCLHATLTPYVLHFTAHQFRLHTVTNYIELFISRNFQK
jgi:hypothetical protein